MLRYLPGGAQGYGQYTAYDMAAHDGAYSDATGLPSSSSHALVPWPDQEAHEAKPAADETLPVYS